jgi:hypothetical protein
VFHDTLETQSPQCVSLENKEFHITRSVGTRQVGRPRQRCQEDVMEDLEKAESKKLEGNS